MIELFTNIRQEVKEIAETSVDLALIQKDPKRAAVFLDSVVRYYTNFYTDEEINFLKTYFQIKLELMQQ